MIHTAKLNLSETISYNRLRKTVFIVLYSTTMTTMDDRPESSASSFPPANSTCFESLTVIDDDYCVIITIATGSLLVVITLCCLLIILPTYLCVRKKRKKTNTSKLPGSNLVKNSRIERSPANVIGRDLIPLPGAAADYIEPVSSAEWVSATQEGRKCGHAYTHLNPASMLHTNTYSKARRDGEGEWKIN